MELKETDQNGRAILNLSNTGIAGLNPSRNMDVCFSVLRFPVQVKVPVQGILPNN
jgi:hypothetical protein